MGKSKVEVKWNEKMSFLANVNGHQIKLDADASVGGNNEGPRPKPLLMVALAGCTGMDVVSILEKMKVQFDAFSVDVEGNMTDEHPKIYDHLNIIYKFKGKDLPIEKLEKAVNLSQEKYCGVSAMLGKSAKITHQIIIEN